MLVVEYGAIIPEVRWDSGVFRNVWVISVVMCNIDTQHAMYVLL